MPILSQNSKIFEIYHTITIERKNDVIVWFFL